MSNIKLSYIQREPSPSTASPASVLPHAQIGEGNLIELCRRALPFIGEIQVADVPGR
jgi:hypothetical protein